MSGKDLFEAMSYVDERFVEEAGNDSLPKRMAPLWIKAASMAACLCLILFSLYSLSPYFNRGETEGAAGQEAADGAPEGEVDNELVQESAVAAPEDVPTGEVSSVILYVEEMTDIGFVATVAELVDSAIFEIGMELNVVIAKGTRHETADGNPSMIAESKIDYSGTYVTVQFVKYNRETATIVVNMIQKADVPVTSP